MTYNTISFMAVVDRIKEIITSFTLVKEMLQKQFTANMVRWVIMAERERIKKR